MSKEVLEKREDPQEAELLNYAMESSFLPDGRLKYSRQRVAFQLYTIGRKIHPVRIQTEFYCDYGMYFGQDDDYIIETLQEVLPEISWGSYIFWRDLDGGRINVIDGDNDKIVAVITTRQNENGKVVKQILDSVSELRNVVRLSDWKTNREDSKVAAKG